MNAPTDPDQPRSLSASVAMATYNGWAFVGAQLDSILAQTVLPDEIVITDDQSTDGTFELLTAHAARSPVPMRVHRNPQRLGFTRNFARAIGLCASELIFLCDQDDIWLPEKIAVMKAAFADPRVLLAYHGALVVNGENEPLYEFYNAAQENALLATQPMDPWYSSYGLTQAFRSSLRAHDDLWPQSLNHVWIEGERLSHDQWYFFLAEVLGEMRYVDRSLVRYRQHGGNTVGASAVSRAQGWRAKLAAKLQHIPRLDRLRADAAERRAAILDQLAKRLEAPARDRAAALAVEYLRLAARLRRRYAVHTGASAPARLAALGGSLARGDYRGQPWAFHPRSLVRDLAGGLLSHKAGADASAGAPSVGT